MSASFERSAPVNLTLLVPYASYSDPLTGTEYKAYNLHPDLLTAPYFLEQFTELSCDDLQVIVLDQILVEHFDVYQHWLLTGELLFIDKGGEAKSVGPTKQQANEGYNKLLHCCSLACVLGDDVFLDALANKLINTLRLGSNFQSELIRLLTPDRIKCIAAEAGTHSGLFKLLAHAYARFASVDEIRVLAFTKCNALFKCQVMQSMASMRAHQHMDDNDARDFVVGPCHYHTHSFYAGCTQKE